MKKTFLSIAVLISGLFISSQIISSCSNKNDPAKEENTGNMNGDSMKNHDKMGMDSTNLVYACPMHPEEKGKKGDKCPKCGMLMEPVKQKDHEGNDHDNDDHDHDK
ncbi:MAG: hypothetical protein HYX66_07640 [Ignavibacteria bacterium]|nr:hypothetical protein [Ignavibacteria bacterium]